LRVPSHGVPELAAQGCAIWKAFSHMEQGRADVGQAHRIVIAWDLMTS
jgi:hypothetical protein